MFVILASVLLVGCRQGTSVTTETVAGLVVEKHANARSYDSWNAPSDPYYVLEEEAKIVMLRPSASVRTEKLSTLRGMRVRLSGYHTKGEPYKPTEAGEQYPMEPDTDIGVGTNGMPESTRMRPANRGAGFVVTRILEMK